MVGGLVDTGAGNDLIEVDYGGGVSRTLNLELGTGEDDLEFDGTDVTAVVDYTVGPGADDGTLVTTIGM